MKTILDFLVNDCKDEELQYVAQNMNIYKDKEKDPAEEYSVDEKVEIFNNLIQNIYNKSKNYKPKEKRNVIVEFMPYVTYYQGEKEESLDFSCIYAENYLEYLEQYKDEDDFSAAHIGFSPMGLDTLEIVQYYISPYALHTTKRSELAYTILYELTWFGFDLDTINENIKDFSDTLFESYEAFHTGNVEGCTLEEVKEDLGLEDFTEEEKEQMQKDSDMEIEKNKEIRVVYSAAAYDYIIKSNEPISIFQPSEDTSNL